MKIDMTRTPDFDSYKPLFTWPDENQPYILIPRRKDAESQSFRITKHPIKDRRALLEREFQAITKVLGSTTTAMLDKLIKDASPLSSEIDKAVKSAGLTPYPLYG